jgi:Amidohydrolase family
MPIGDPPYYLDVPGCLRDGRFPTRADLDRVSPRNPVYIRAIWGYWRHRLPLVSIANSLALARAGIARDTRPPWEGIEIERDGGGEPTGVFVERTYVPMVELTLMAAAPRFTHADRVRGLRESMRIYAAMGTTSVFGRKARSRRASSPTSSSAPPIRSAWTRQRCPRSPPTSPWSAAASSTSGADSGSGGVNRRERLAGAHRAPPESAIRSAESRRHYACGERAWGAVRSRRRPRPEPLGLDATAALTGTSPRRARRWRGSRRSTAR